MKSMSVPKSLLIVWCCLVVFCVAYPTITLTNLIANAFLIFIWVIAVFVTMVWSTWICMTRIRPGWKRAVLSSVGFLLSVVCFFGATVTGIGLFWANNDELQPIAHVQGAHSMIIAYRTNGGATTDYGVTVRRERLLLPGVLYVHYLLTVYPAHDAQLRVLGKQQVEIVVSPYHGNPGQTMRVEM